MLAHTTYNLHNKIKIRKSHKIFHRTTIISRKSFINYYQKAKDADAVSRGKSWGRRDGRREEQYYLNIHEISLK